MEGLRCAGSPRPALSLDGMVREALHWVAGAGFSVQCLLFCQWPSSCLITWALSLLLWSLVSSSRLWTVLVHLEDLWSQLVSLADGIYASGLARSHLVPLMTQNMPSGLRVCRREANKAKWLVVNWTHSFWYHYLQVPINSTRQQKNKCLFEWGIWNFKVRRDLVSRAEYLK